MIPTVSVVGKSNSGKTTLVEKLIAELTARGFKVASVKYTAHHFDPDTEGKDTWRHTKAGAVASALVTPEKTALFLPGERPSLDELIYEHITLADIVITEGGKHESAPKIWVLGSPEEKVECKAEELIAVAADFAVESAAPLFTRNDSTGMADLIQKTFLKNVSRSDVKVWLDGKFLEIKPFVKAFIGQTIKGMLSSLKGGKRGEKIHIKIGR
jgi:molybdopterin-guanine dinucleotide biosynthesis protein MobB